MNAEHRNPSGRGALFADQVTLGGGVSSVLAIAFLYLSPRSCRLAINRTGAKPKTRAKSNPAGLVSTLKISAKGGNWAATVRPTELAMCGCNSELNAGLNTSPLKKTPPRPASPDNVGTKINLALLRP